MRRKRRNRRCDGSGSGCECKGIDLDGVEGGGSGVCSFRNSLRGAMDDGCVGVRGERGCGVCYRGRLDHVFGTGGAEDFGGVGLEGKWSLKWGSPLF